MIIYAGIGYGDDGNCYFMALIEDVDENGKEIEHDFYGTLGSLICWMLNNNYDEAYRPLADILRKSGDFDVLERVEHEYSLIIEKLNKQNLLRLKDLIDNVFVNQDNPCACIPISKRLYYYIYFFDEISFSAKISPRPFGDENLTIAQIPSNDTDKLIMYKQLCSNDEDNMKPQGYFEFDYELSTLEDLINCCIFEMANKEVSLKKCSNCGKYFVPTNRSDTIYCDNQAPQDPSKTCKKYGAIKAYQNNLKKNESMSLYRTIYMSKQMLVKRSKEKEDNELLRINTESFEKFKILSAQWKSDVKTGSKTEQEFIEWLKAVKEKKVL